MDKLYFVGVYVSGSGSDVRRFRCGNDRKERVVVVGQQCSGRLRSRRVSGMLSMSSASKLEALIFDCDGVLADTERDAHRVAFNIAFAERQLDTVWDTELYGHLLETGGGKERMTAHWNRVGWPSVVSDEKARIELVRELHARKTQVFMDLIESGKIPLRNGVVELVDQALVAGIPIAVCSTSNELAVAKIVGLMGAERAKEIRIFAGDIVSNKKPSPDIYLLAKDTLDLRAEKVVVVEDSFIGLQAAKDAGMKCVITKSTYTVNEDFSRADKIYDELAKDNVSLATLTDLI